MLCPVCLGNHRFRLEATDKANEPSYTCAEIGEPVPPKYVWEYRSAPPVVVSAVGFRGHGKTVYFASLFYTLERLAATSYWPGFYTMSLNDESVRTVKENVALLDQGHLPDSTPKNFPKPTIIRIDNLPTHRDGTLLCYDTGGEAFERAEDIGRYARFVRRARTAMLLISVPDLEVPAREMHQLLNTYVLGMAQLGGNTTEQDLVIVYTKADQLRAELDEWEDLRDYLMGGTVEGLRDMTGYIRAMRRASTQLRRFTFEKLDAQGFLSLADSNFRSIEFSMISALGSKPEGATLPVQIVPRRVMDPLLWLMERSAPPWQRFLRRR